MFRMQIDLMRLEQLVLQEYLHMVEAITEKCMIRIFFQELGWIKYNIKMELRLRSIIFMKNYFY